MSHIEQMKIDECVQFSTAQSQIKWKNYHEKYIKRKHYSLNEINEINEVNEENAEI